MELPQWPVLTHAPSCGRLVKQAVTGRPRRYCSNRCRQKGYRRRRYSRKLAVAIPIPSYEEVKARRNTEQDTRRSETLMDFYAADLFPEVPERV
jgi:hypothetical protein